MSYQSPPRLGLKLTKTPALLERIQMVLSRQENAGLVQEVNAGLVQQENAGMVQEENTGMVQEENVGMVQEENIGLAVATKGEKRKACNFHASVLRIGSWEWTSKYSGDLVAKIYFGKKKLIWEVMKEGLKSKMEFSWSDIKGLKTYLPENQPGTLTIVLDKPPMFSTEIKPEPQQHTKWDSTSDFTNGQASKYKQHVLQCLPGMMNKHIESLLQSDPRLFKLRQEPEISLDSPFFDVGPSEPSVLGSQNMASYTVVAQPPPSEHPQLLPSSGVEANTTTGGDQMNVTGLEDSDDDVLIDITDYMYVNPEVNSFEYTTNSQISSDVGTSSGIEIGLDNMNGHIREKYSSIGHESAIKESSDNVTVEEKEEILTKAVIKEFFANEEKLMNEQLGEIGEKLAETSDQVIMHLE